MTKYYIRLAPIAGIPQGGVEIECDEIEIGADASIACLILIPSLEPDKQQAIAYFRPRTWLYWQKLSTDDLKGCADRQVALDDANADSITFADVVKRFEKMFVDVSMGQPSPYFTIIGEQGRPSKSYEYVMIDGTGSTEADAIWNWVRKAMHYASENENHRLRWRVKPELSMKRNFDAQTAEYQVYSRLVAIDAE